jgi:4-amino-4-deoxy-L-arabinose transferase-like glycosyltransferase
MVGVVVTLLVCVAAVGLGRLLTARLTPELDPAAKLGISGLIGLGVLGWITLPIGLVPGGLQWGVYVIAFLAIVGAGAFGREFKNLVPSVTVPAGPWLLIPLAVTIAVLFSLVGVLAPSDTLDWDSLAYHLAVPKLWLQSGQIEFISFIHHSNFPFVIDNLFIWGQVWGGQPGAKAFTLGFLLLGLAAIFGLTRQEYGDGPAWWATLVFASIPSVIWLSGTAYIDVSNGLYAGLAVVFAALAIQRPEERGWLWLCGLFLGFAAGSKYTGLQTIAAVCLVYAGLTGRSSPSLAMKNSALVAMLALAVACPWYIRNVANTGNPVYPFFYSVFGGKNWDSFSSKIYTEEQKTFGVGASPLDLTQIGHAVLGLAYQPGRYINPAPTTGSGVPVGALGVVPITALMLWAFTGPRRKFERAIVCTVGISLILWFGLSQQSRYIIALAVPLAVIGGGATSRMRLGPALAGLIGIQAVYSLYLLHEARVADQLRVALGQVSREEYLSTRVGFFEPASLINTVVGDGKVALYDEVFGYFLNVPYFWANPGHTTELGYAEMKDGDDLVAAYRRLGITHVYLNFGIYNPQDPSFQRWLAALGLSQGRATPYSGTERDEQMRDIRNGWKVLVADAVASGNLVMVEQFRRSVLLRVVPEP